MATKLYWLLKLMLPCCVLSQALRCSSLLVSQGWGRQIEVPGNKVGVKRGPKVTFCNRKALRGRKWYGRCGNRKYEEQEGGSSDIPLPQLSFILRNLKKKLSFTFKDFIPVCNRLCHNLPSIEAAAHWQVISLPVSLLLWWGFQSSHPYEFCSISSSLLTHGFVQGHGMSVVDSAETFMELKTFLLNRWRKMCNDG